MERRDNELGRGNAIMQLDLEYREFVYDKIKDDIDWTILRPSDFSTGYSPYSFAHCSFLDERKITDDNIDKICGL